MIINAIRHTFKNNERLKREHHIETLFRKGKAFSVFPLRVLSNEVGRDEGETSPVRAGFSVPKKKFKHATDRNRIKRLMREAWRLQKHIVYDAIPQDKQLHLFFIFTDTTLPKYDTIRDCVDKAISRLAPLQIESKDA